MTQLTTDGLAAYPPAVYEAFGDEVNYAQLIKVYKATGADHARYSPADCVGCRKKYVIGTADRDHISTSYVEWHNLSIRMGMRRCTRLTNAHSKKAENHAHAMALSIAFYNHCRVHSTLKTSPVVAAGVADHVWTLEELIGLAY